ncbi:related to Sedlin (trafficking protein particle complex protein 2) [Sporisorium reilianum SRZ2]|uniref:Related to Sedlin (Trafficking protein particle complex protein 2) n=1 Tax=Sporisorium reilianum (strain SRZ2) TaxID=999809 RepID=E6ZQM1_SPORE|nr:related to Sedlin (trafficking protein particle complex protein 2) [Sporisorium reilianum SRZ2]
MSYYLTLIGTRDNPLYETEITPKTAASSSSASTSSGLFSSSSSSAGAASSGSGAAAGAEAGSSGGGMFGGLLSRIPTTSSALTSSGNSAAPSGAGAGSGAAVGAGARRKQRYELQMIAHSALDTIEDALITSPYLYLKSIDRIQEYTTSCFVLPGNVKMVLLHEHKHEDGIKNFFLDVWEAYLKVSMNPFQDANAPIENAAFDARVRAAAKKFL